MDEKIKQTQFDKVGVNPFSAPTPGESLTTPTDMPKAWERPPQYIDQGNAMEAVYMELTQIENLKKLIDLIDEGTALDEIAQVVLYKGYSEGKWNPDLMMLLIEPTLYLLIAIADYADIKDSYVYDKELAYSGKTWRDIFLDLAVGGSHTEDNMYIKRII